jgi:hypothetical protein
MVAQRLQRRDGYGNGNGNGYSGYGYGNDDG